MKHARGIEYDVKLGHRVIDAARKLAQQINLATLPGGGELVDEIIRYDRMRIPADEPVFLLRAQDRHAGPTVRFWAGRCNLDEVVDERLVRYAEDWAEEMDAWPKKKSPDMPSEAQLRKDMAIGTGLMTAEEKVGLDEVLEEANRKVDCNCHRNDGEHAIGCDLEEKPETVAPDEELPSGRGNSVTAETRSPDQE